MGILFSFRNRRRHILHNELSTGAANHLVWSQVPSGLSALGITYTLKAVAVDINGKVLLTQPLITYGTSNASIGSVSGTNNSILTSVANGTFNVTASSVGLADISSSVTIAQVVSSVSVTPNTPSITQGNTQQFTAVAKDSNNQTITPLPAGTWSSSDPTDIPINGTGLATGTNIGSAVIKYQITSNGIYGTASITVIASGSDPVIGPNDYVGVDVGGALAGITTQAALDTYMNDYGNGFGNSNQYVNGTGRYLSNFNNEGTKAIGGNIGAVAYRTLSSAITVTGSQTITLSGNTPATADHITIDPGGANQEYIPITSGAGTSSIVCSPTKLHAAGVTVVPRVDGGTYTTVKRVVTPVKESYFEWDFFPGLAIGDTGGLGTNPAVEGSNFQWNNPDDVGQTSCKRLFFTNSSNATRRLYLCFRPNDNYIMLSNDAGTYNSGPFDLHPNTANTCPTKAQMVGQHCKVKVHLIASTGTAGTQGNADGLFEMWISVGGGAFVKTHYYPNIAIYPDLFDQIQIEGTWTTPKYNMSHYTNDLKVWESGKVPGIPTAGTASVGTTTGQATIPVTPASSYTNGVPTKIKVYVSSDGGTTFTYDSSKDFTLSGDTRGKTQQITLSGFTDGVAQYVKFSGINGVGESALSTVCTFTTSATGGTGLITTGLMSDLDISTGTNTTTNGQTVTSWTDNNVNSAGHGNVFTNVGTPTYKTNADGTVPAVHFSPGNYLQCSTPAGNANDDETIYLVVDNSAASATDQVIVATGTTNKGFQIYRENNGSGNNRFAASAGTGTGTTFAGFEVVLSVGSGTPYALVLGLSKTGAPNNTLQIGATTSAGSSTAYVSDYTKEVIGANLSGANGATIDVIRRIRYSGRHSPAQITQMQNYLHGLYGT